MERKGQFTRGPMVAKQEFSNRWRIEKTRDGFVPLSVALAWDCFDTLGEARKSYAKWLRHIKELAK